MKKGEVLYMIQENTGISSDLRIMKDSNTSSNRGLQFDAIFQFAEAPNQNRRLYKKIALEEGIRNVLPKVHKRQFLNEQCHPITENIQRFTSIDLGNVSHLITDFRWEGNTLKGVGECLNTRIGKDMEAMIKQDIPVEFSLRALGKTVANKTSGLTEVTSNVKVFCYDWVHNASHKGSEIQSIISESVSNADVASMLLTESEKLNILKESMGNDQLEVFNFNEKDDISYNLAENTVQFCSNGSCMKVFLEDFIQDEFRSSFSKLLNN